MVRRFRLVARCVVSGAVLMASMGGGPSAGAAAIFVPLAIDAPESPVVGQVATACTSPAPVHTSASFHCYTPADISAAYGVKAIHDTLNFGQGQTIVLVDSYGSPTAANDINFFHNTFYPNLPAPDFTEWYPFGNPTTNYVCSNSAGLSGPCSAAGWSEEATLDIEWAYAIAPLAKIVLLATPPAETLGVPGLPNMFKGMQMAIDKYPAGTIFSQSFGLAEQTFGGAALNQMTAFDQTYRNGEAKGDSFLASSGDSGNGGNQKNAKLTGVYPFTVIGYPASSPEVTAVGGTQLMFGWTLAPTAANPLAFVSGGNTEAVWNECPIFGSGNCVTGGGVSSFFAAPSWQAGQQTVNHGMRSIPDLSWDAAVDGGVLVYITSYPTAIRSGWHIFGGTSASSPQMAGVIALANTARHNLGKGPLGNLGPHIYPLGNHDAAAPDSSFGGNATSLFRDVIPQTFGSGAGAVTLNNNQWFDPAPPYFATPGYDLTTGFGSPRADRFIDALASQ